MAPPQPSTKNVQEPSEGSEVETSADEQTEGKLPYTVKSLASYFRFGSVPTTEMNEGTRGKVCLTFFVICILCLLPITLTYQSQRNPNPSVKAAATLAEKAVS